MIWRVLRWLLRFVDFDVSLDGDVVHVVLKLGGHVVLDFRRSLIKEV